MFSFLTYVLYILFILVKSTLSFWYSGRIIVEYFSHNWWLRYVTSVMHYSTHHLDGL